MLQENREQSLRFRRSPKRSLIFVTSILALSSFLGLIGAYAMLKKYLSDEIGIEEGQLGILDAANFLTRSITILYLIFKPLSNPRRAYIIHSTLIVILMLLIPFTPQFQPYTYIALAMIFLISGFSRAFNFIPQFFAHQYFEADGADQIKMRVWLSLASYGDVIAILFMHLFLNYFHWNWKICLWVAIGTFCLLSVIFSCSVDEIIIERPSSNHSQDDE